MKLYDVFTGDELRIAEKIQQRRYQLLIHSCIYYELNSNIISDAKWNSWANELRELQNQYPEISQQIVLHEYFKDWDGSTGAFLPITERWVVDIANKLLSHKNGVNKKPKKEKRRLF